MIIRTNLQYPMVVKILFNDDGDKEEQPKWHYIEMPDGAERTLCSGEVFGEGEGRAIYKKKRGKITCPSCIQLIKKYKAVKL